jgi:ribosome-binding ATPase YchF (GTP1/OBG family)
VVGWISFVASYPTSAEVSGNVAGHPPEHLVNTRHAGAPRQRALAAVEGSFADLRARGQQRLEGKDYVVRDGEICHFRFNVAK